MMPRAVHVVELFREYVFTVICVSGELDPRFRGDDEQECLTQIIYLDFYPGCFYPDFKRHRIAHQQ